MTEKSNAEIMKERELDNIRNNLKLIAHFLTDPLLTDIHVSSEGNVSIKRFGHPTTTTKIRLEYSSRMQILNQIAKYMEQPINFYNYPVLEATIPVPEWKNARITGIFQPWVSQPSMTIRKPPERIYTLEQYVENKQLSQERYDLIIDYVKKRKNIIVAGSTGSGKTTFMNAVIKKKTEYFPKDRYFIVQDVSELQCAAEYQEILIIRSDQAIKAVALSLRYTPDCIIFGEVRKGEVMAELLDAWNTGHPGGITSLHANSALKAITRVKKLLLDHYESEGALPDLQEYIDLIVFLRKDADTGITVEEALEMHSLDPSVFT